MNCILTKIVVHHNRLFWKMIAYFIGIDVFFILGKQILKIVQMFKLEILGI